MTKVRISPEFSNTVGLVNIKLEYLKEQSLWVQNIKYFLLAFCQKMEHLHSSAGCLVGGMMISMVPPFQTYRLTIPNRDFPTI